MEVNGITTSFHMYNVTESSHLNYIYPFITLSLSLTSSSLSILGGIFIIASYIVLPEIRNFTRQLVVSLTVADLFTAFGIWVSVIRYFNLHEDYVVNRSMEDVLCKMQSFLTTLTSLVSFFLTSIIAIYIFDTVTGPTNRLNSTRWLFFFNFISWTIPGLSSCFIIITRTAT